MTISTPTKSVSLFILIFYQTSYVNSQKFNNAYVTLGHGFERHLDMNFNCPFLKYFSSSIYTGETNQIVGPLYYPSKGLFSKGKRLQNNYQYSGFLFGISTWTKKFYDISRMVGYSTLKTLEYLNIEKN